MKKRVGFQKNVIAQNSTENKNTTSAFNNGHDPRQSSCLCFASCYMFLMASMSRLEEACELREILYIYMCLYASIKLISKYSKNQQSF